MNKFVLLLIIVGGLLLGLPPLFGLWAEQKVEDQIAQINSEQRYRHYLNVELNEYERGWFSSKANLSFRLGSEFIETLDASRETLKNAATDIATSPNNNALNKSERAQAALQFLSASLPLEATIKHGPVNFDEELFVGLYKTVMEIGLDLPKLDAALALAEMPYLMRIVSRTGLTGATTYAFLMPPGELDEKDGKMKFSGFVVEGSANTLSGAATFTGSMDYFDLVTDDVEFRINGLTLDGDLTQDSEYIWPGITHLGMRQISIDAREGATDNLMIADGLQFTQETRVANQDDTVFFSFNYQLENFSLNGESKFRDFEFSTTLDHLHKGALERYIKFAQTLDPSSESNNYAMMAEIQEVVHPLLSTGPTITFDPLRFTTSDGPVEASLNFFTQSDRLPSADQFSLFDIGMWSNLFRLEIKLNMAEAIARELTTQVLKGQIRKSVPEGTTVSEEQIQGMAQMQGPQMLLMLVQQGMMELGGHGYQTHILYGDGALTINGTPMPLASLLGGALGAKSPGK